MARIPLWQCCSYRLPGASMPLPIHYLASKHSGSNLPAANHHDSMNCDSSRKMMRKTMSHRHRCLLLLYLCPSTVCHHHLCSPDFASNRLMVLMSCHWHEIAKAAQKVYNQTETMKKPM